VPASVYLKTTKKEENNLNIMLKKQANTIIGVFDSGLGGLSVMKHFLQKLPQYDYIYLGDTARVPYGNHSQDRIYQYTLEAVEFLFAQGCQLIILACNTASSQALRKLQSELLPKKYPDRRILGVIVPLAEEVTHFKNIGIIGTRATINSQAYEQEIRKINPEAIINSQSTPLLVPLIEEGGVSEDIIHKILKKYLRPLKSKRIDYLILACTHYPFLLKNIRRLIGKQCVVPDPGEIVANKLKDYLERHLEFSTKNKKTGSRQFFVTDNPASFIANGEKFLGQKMDNCQNIKL
jgi:glutamate racemase